MNARLRSAFYPFALFAINIAVAWRYLRAGYINQLPSIEGGFIALEEYIRHHWPLYDWFPLWYAGLPFTRTYQPGFHYAVALLSKLTHLEAVSAFHAWAACMYAMGAVGFYFLARSLGLEKEPSFLGALLFSFFSPSTLISPAVRQDAGGIFHPRRLQVLAIYGEGPNVTGLMLGMFALAAIHVALRRKTPAASCIAAATVALVPIVNWPATMALVMAIVCYLAAMEWGSGRLAQLRRMVVIGLLAIGFALPFALPSTMFSTLARANVMMDAPTAGPARWISFGLLLVCFLAARFALARSRAGFPLRFALLWAMLLAWFVVAASAFDIRMIPQAIRFHAAMEVPIILAATIAGVMLPGRRIVAALVLLFCAFQAHTYRQWLHERIATIDIRKASEYQMAKWTDASLKGQRIFVAGTFRFWLNAFTETPQVTGLFDQSIINPLDPHVEYILSNGYLSNQQSAELSLLWLKAFGAGAVNAEGPGTADFYKDFQFPNRFEGLLPALWSRGGDTVYAVPEHTPGLARIVRIRDLVRHVPENGADVRELKPFVQALDDPSLPQARFHWQGANQAQITGSFTPDQAIAVAINFDPGWTATVNGHAANLHKDGLGFIAIAPGCSGSCTIDMQWTQGWEPAFAITMFVLALAAASAWCLL